LCSRSSPMATGSNGDPRLIARAELSGRNTLRTCCNDSRRRPDLFQGRLSVSSSQYGSSDIGVRKSRDEISASHCLLARSSCSPALLIGSATILHFSDWKCQHVNHSTTVPWTALSISKGPTGSDAENLFRQPGPPLCLSLQIGEMQGDVDEMRGGGKHKQVKFRQISIVWMGLSLLREQGGFGS